MEICVEFNSYDNGNSGDNKGNQVPSWFEVVNHALSGYSNKYLNNICNLPLMFTSHTNKQYKFIGTIQDNKITGNFTLHTTYHTESDKHGHEHKHEHECEQDHAYAHGNNRIIIDGYVDANLAVPISVLIHVGLDTCYCHDQDQSQSQQQSQSHYEMFNISDKGLLVPFGHYYETQTKLTIPKIGICNVNYYETVDTYDNGELAIKNNKLFSYYFTTSTIGANACPFDDKTKDHIKHMKINKQLIKLYNVLSPKWLYCSGNTTQNVSSTSQHNNNNNNGINKVDVICIDDKYLNDLQKYCQIGFCYKSIIGDKFIKWYYNGCIESLVVGDKTYILEGKLIRNLSHI